MCVCVCVCVCVSGPADLLLALVSLPVVSQAELINKLPKATQAQLVRSLTKKEKKRLVEALTKKGATIAAGTAPSSSVIEHFDEDPNDEFCVIPPAYIERATAIAVEESSTTQRRRRANAAPAPLFSMSSDSASAPSGGAQEPRLSLESSKNPRTFFLPIIQRMMLSFGDIHYTHDSNSSSAAAAAAAASWSPAMVAPAADSSSGHLSWPSLYTAMRIQEHIECWLSGVLAQLPTDRKPLQTLTRMFPLQSRVYFKWKRMNSMAKQEQHGEEPQRRQEEEEGSKADAETEQEDAPVSTRSLRVAPSSSSFSSSARGKRKSVDLSPTAKRPPTSASKRRKNLAGIAETPAKRGRKKAGAVAAAAAAANDDVDLPASGRGSKRGAPRSRPPAKRGKHFPPPTPDSDGGGDGSVAGSEAESGDGGGGGGSDSAEDDSSPDASDDDSNSPGSSRSSSDAEDAEADDPLGIETDLRLAAPEEEEDEQDADINEMEEIIASAVDQHAGRNAVAAAAAAAALKLGQDERKESVTPASSASSSSSSSAFDLFFPSLSLHLGPLHRLAKQDALSQHMSSEHFTQFVKCREASFVYPGRRQKLLSEWTGLPQSTSKSVLLLLGYLAWDRIGMIVELCVALRECSRHARSNVPFTIYEVNAALRMLEEHPMTSQKQWRDEAFGGFNLQKQLQAYYESKGLTTMPPPLRAPLTHPKRTPLLPPPPPLPSLPPPSPRVEQQLPPPPPLPLPPLSHVYPIAAPPFPPPPLADYTATPRQLPHLGIELESDMAALDEALATTHRPHQHQQNQCLPAAAAAATPMHLPTEAPSSAALLESNHSLLAPSSLAPAPAPLAPAHTLPSPLTFPFPFPFLPLPFVPPPPPAAAAPLPLLPLPTPPSPSFPSSPPAGLIAPKPLKGRFTDAQKAKLAAVGAACSWKFRIGHPRVVQLAAEEGLEPVQIRGWMQNNKPEYLRKRQK